MQIGYIPAVACCDQHSMRGSPTYAGKKRRFSYTKPHPDERCHQSKLVPRRDTPPITVHGNAGPHTCCSSSRISVLPIGGSRRGPRTNDGQRFPRQHHFLGQFFPFSCCGPPYTQTFSIAVQLSRSMRILVLAYVSSSSCAIVETYLTHRLARLVRTPWHLGQLEEIFTFYWNTRMPNYCRTYLSHPENNHLEESVSASP